VNPIGAIIPLVPLSPMFIATYEAHPRRPTDTRSCSAVSKTVPQYQMRNAHSTTLGEDPPQGNPRGVRRAETAVNRVFFPESRSY
jgi:hypothetical protein